nr:sugar transporter stl1 [Quercus suber]
MIRYNFRLNMNDFRAIIDFVLGTWQTPSSRVVIGSAADCTPHLPLGSPQSSEDDVHARWTRKARQASARLLRSLRRSYRLRNLPSPSVCSCLVVSLHVLCDHHHLTMADDITSSAGVPTAAKYMGLRGSGLRSAIGLTAGLCFISFGYGQGDVGGLLTVPSFQVFFPRMDIVGQYANIHVAVTVGIVVATWNIGCFFGSIVTFALGDRFGRRDIIILGLLCLLIGKTVQTSSFSLAQYIVGRFIAGTGNGFIASTVPAWQAECLKTHRRGTLLLVSFGSCITGGLAIAYWVAYGMSFTAPSSASWRFTIAFVIVFILAALAMILSLPESPRWLILTGREEEAKRVLAALNERSSEDEDIRREFLMIKNTLLHMSSGGLLRTFSQGEYRYLQRVLLAVCLQIMQQVWHNHGSTHCEQD